MSIGVITGIVTQGAGITLMARLAGTAGQLVTPASIATIVWQVTDLIAGTIIGNGTFAVATTVFGSLVTGDARWTPDAIGYNFLGLLAAGTIPITVPSGGPSWSAQQTRPYQVDVKFTATDGSIFYAVYQIQAVPVYF